MEVTQITQTPDELKFAEEVAKLQPILKELDHLLSDGRVSLKGQKYRIDNNNLTIIGQEKQIAENKQLIEDNKKKANDIIAVAQERAKEIDNNTRNRVAQINHMEREAKQKFEAAEKKLWQAKEKIGVKDSVST